MALWLICSAGFLKSNRFGAFSAKLNLADLLYTNKLLVKRIRGIPQGLHDLSVNKFERSDNCGGLH